MTRSDFIRAYAKRSNLPDDASEFARIGRLRVDGQTLHAMPCGCNDPECEGWAMVGDDILEHLELHAPAELRDAYRAAINAVGGH